MPGTLKNVVVDVNFPRAAPYIVSAMIDNYGIVKIDDVLIVDVPTHTLVFSKCTKLTKGTHYIKYFRNLTILWTRNDWNQRLILLVQT